MGTWGNWWTSTPHTAGFSYYFHARHISAISNRSGVEVAEIFDKSFEEIGFDDINNYPFSLNIDIIGYDWKTFTGGSFTVHPEQSYLVKTTEGIYFKIHFIDFYNQMGDKGNPKFEVVAL